MNLRKLRNRLGVASSIGAAAAAVLMMGVGLAQPASAAITVPAFPTFGAYPNWLPANFQVSNVDHSEGSDTTLFVMQAISDLYSQAGIFPFSCQLTTSPQNQQCLTPANNSGNNPNNTQSDTVDNFAGTEELQGINDVGSGNGQGELCGTIGTPVGTTVDYARSSKPSAGTCSTEQGFGYAKDAVTAVDFQNINPALYGSPTGYLAVNTSLGGFTSYNNAGTAVITPFPSGGIGAVADGWLPGDPTNCGESGAAACSGTPFSDVDNTSTLGGAGSVAYRLWCQHGASGTAGESQITDWGQLTNLAGGTLAVGSGAPIGVPIRVIGVNSGSGTAATWNNFSKSGSASGNCTATSNYNENAASGSNPQTNQGPTGNLEIAVENDANQIGDFANADWPASDAADQATDIATSLYYMGNGAYLSNPNASVANLEATSGVPAGAATSFTETQLSSNSVTVSTATERNNSFPASRTLFNIIRTDTVRASVGGFMNFMCDGGLAAGQTPPVINGISISPMFAKGTDHINGGNFDTDLTNIINGQYDYSRNTDITPELSAASQLTANGVVNQNGTCEATQTIHTTGGVIDGISSGNTTVTLSAPVPSTIQVGWPVYVPTGYSLKIPTGTTVASISGSTIVLSGTGPSAGTGSSLPPTLYFPGHPPVLAVANANS